MTAAPTSEVSLSAQEQYLSEVHHTTPLPEGEEATFLVAYREVAHCLHVAKQKMRQAQERLTVFQHQFPRADVSAFAQAVHRYEREVAAWCERVQAAAAPLVEAYQPLVLHVAQRYHRHASAQTLLDLVQEGNTGLLHALATYDTASGAGFSTYAFICIRGAITSVLWQGDGLIRVPDHMVRALRRLDQVEAHLCTRLARTPSENEVATALGVDLATLRELLLLRQQEMVSLDTMLVEGESLRVADVVADDTLPSAASTVVLDAAVATLSPQEQRYVRARYGDAGAARVAQAQVARSLGLTRVQAERVEHRIRRHIAQQSHEASPASLRLSGKHADPTYVEAMRHIYGHLW